MQVSHVSPAGAPVWLISSTQVVVAEWRRPMNTPYYPGNMFGSHLSIASGLHNALLKAEELELDTVQIFTKNQQQWRCKPLTADEIDPWHTNAKRMGFKKTVSHGSYLINLASPVAELWQKSLELTVEEVRRCDALGIPYLVMHPGAHIDGNEARGLACISRALDEVEQRLPDSTTTICLEITAGQGTCLGHRLEHLAEIIGTVRNPKRLGICLDTAHLFTAGYDFRGRKYAAFRRLIGLTVGIKQIKVWHLNDSKRELSSRVDRHDHIGQGHIGLRGFAGIVRDEAFVNVPKILETPKETAPDGRDWDLVNLEHLRSLI